MKKIKFSRPVLIPAAQLRTEACRQVGHQCFSLPAKGSRNFPKLVLICLAEQQKHPEFVYFLHLLSTMESM